MMPGKLLIAGLLFLVAAPLAARPSSSEKPYTLPDTLGPARAAWKAGDPRRAAELASAAGGATGSLMAGLALVEAGENRDAVIALRKVPSSHPLFNTAQAALVPALRREGALREARSLARALVKRGERGARYLLADVMMAMEGCGAAEAWRTALRGEPAHPGRHGARRALLGCSPKPELRARLALDMMEDAEPVDADAGLEALLKLFVDEKPPFGMRGDLAIRVAERLLGAGKLVEAEAMLRVPPSQPELLGRWAVVRAKVARGQGRHDDALGILDRALAAGVGAMESTLHRMRAEVLGNGKGSEELARLLLDVADRFPGDPVAVECRHMAAYHYAEAGKIDDALAHWEQVAAVPGARQQDAAWFVARALARRGEHRKAAEKADAVATRLGGSDGGAHARYWAARWWELAGDAERARRDWVTLCQGQPGRLHARFACERAALPIPPPPPAPPDIPDDAFEPLVRLAAHPALPAGAVRDVEEAAALTQVGALGSARSALRRAIEVGRKGPEETALALGEAALSLGDAHAAVMLALRRRGEAGLQGDARWLRLAYPRPEPLVRAARAEGVDEDLVLAIARTESLFAPGVRSPAGAMGLMQLLPTTARNLRKAEEGSLEAGALMDPDVNATLGARYLKRLQGDFGDRVELVACGYNAGPTAARKFVQRGKGLGTDEFLESINYRETRGYARKVLGAYLNYRALRGMDARCSPSAVLDVTPGDSLTF
ncbi:MAG: lytic transglycosylase domain-containing protein [Myxococcota bacterium]